MSKTTRELSGYAIPRPAAGVMLGALHCRRWEPAGWAGIRRLGTSGPGGARPGERGQEGGTLPLGKTQHGAFPGRQRTGRCPGRCAWHGEGTRAQPVPSHAGLAPQVTLTRKQFPPPQGGPAWRRSREEGRRGRQEGRKYGTTQRGTAGGKEAGGVEPSPHSRAGGRAQAAHTHLPLPLPARPAEAPIRRGPRARRARAHTHALGRPARGRAHGFPRARARQAQPQLRSFKAGRALRRSRRAAAMAAPSPETPPRTPDPPRLRPTPRPGPASPSRPRPILRLVPAFKAELRAVSRLSLPHPAPGLFWPNKGIGCFFDVQAASQWAQRAWLAQQ